MRLEAEQLVRDVAQLTGAPAPSLFAADSVGERAEEGFYLIALVGGEGVGKTSLLAALAGTPLPEAAQDPGAVTAYCHEMQAPILRAVLEHEAPGRVRIVTHRNGRLYRQALVDLPAVDTSAEGLAVARRILSHSVFPVWVQSVEKYADARPQALLAELAAGNDPRNFLFCLTRADEAFGEDFAGDEDGSPDPSLSAEAAELRSDYAGRMTRLLGLTQPPRIYLVSAAQPTRFDLPHLEELLSHEKAQQTVADARRRAGVRREKSLLAWLESQDLPAHARRMAHLEDDARAIATDRLLGPLGERAIPALLADVNYRALLADHAMEARAAAYPLIGPFQSMLSGHSRRPGVAAVVDAHVPPDQTADSIRTAFTTLHESHPQVAAMYPAPKPWEQAYAVTAAADLRSRLCGVIERQRGVTRDRLSHPETGNGRGLPLVLVLVPLIWFPFVQPLLEAAFAGQLHGYGLGHTLVTLLGADNLLRSAALLALWFGGVWLWLRWDTQRRVNALLDQWRSTDAPATTLDVKAQAKQWADDLLAEVHSNRRKLEVLAERAAALRRELESPAAAA